MTTFNKAISALHQGNEAEASALFSQYVVEQATKIQKAITEDFDLDDIVGQLDGEEDDEFGSISDPIDLDEDANEDPDESPEALKALSEGKTFRRSDDEDENNEAEDRFNRDRQRDQDRDGEDLNEGRLELAQEENGDLTVRHSAGTAEAAPVVVEPVATVDSLREAFELELASALVQLKDGMFATGEDAHSNTKSVVGDREKEASPAEVGKGGHSGFALEKAPGSEKVEAQNSLDHASDALEPVKKGGDPKAALNAWGEDKTAVTPVPKN